MLILAVSKQFTAPSPTESDSSICISITILDITHCPVFYLETKFALQDSLNLTGSILCLLYEPNRLMLYIGLWLYNYHNSLHYLLDIIYLPAFHL
jgi:hypothetical protein